jgi:hypothetical protein
MLRLRRKKKKLIDSLMGFYQIVSTIYEDSEKFEESSVRGLMINTHLDFVFPFHKEIVEKHKLPIPNVKKLFKSYIDDWNILIKKEEPHLQELIDNLTYEKSWSYII